jgi:hypothetical protein
VVARGIADIVEVVMLAAARTHFWLLPRSNRAAFKAR